MVVNTHGWKVTQLHSCRQGTVACGCKELRLTTPGLAQLAGCHVALGCSVSGQGDMAPTAVTRVSQRVLSRRT